MGHKFNFFIFRLKSGKKLQNQKKRKKKTMLIRYTSKNITSPEFPSVYPLSQIR